MDPQEGSSALWSLLKFAWVVKSYTLCPLVKFAAGYALFSLGAILLTVLYKLRHQVYNRDLKLKPAACKNRVLVITGAGSGFGLALARYFYSRNFVVVACCYSKDEPGYKELSELQADSTTSCMHVLQLDVQSQASIEACYAYVKKLLDEPRGPHALRLHALLNVAGLGIIQRFQWVPRKTIRDILEVNLLGPMLMTRQFLHLLMRQPGGRVVNVASPLGILPAEMGNVYGPSKAGLAHFSSVLEADTARYGLRTVSIQPGNLIRNTTIISASLAAKLDAAREELNEEERRLYETEMRSHEKLMRLTEEVYSSKRRYSLKLSSAASLKSNLKKLFMIFSGGVTNPRLHECKSFMQSFDNAIRLKHPPREMFAGNIYFVIVVDSLFQWLGRGLIRDIYLNVLRRLRRRRVSTATSGRNNAAAAAAAVDSKVAVD